MDKKFISFMYWVPFTLIIIIALIYGFYVGGIEIFNFYLIIGIIFILLHFWAKYWLKKKYEKYEKWRKKDGN